jgi:hypothetical protein
LSCEEAAKLLGSASDTSEVFAIVTRGSPARDAPDVVPAGSFEPDWCLDLNARFRRRFVQTQRLIIIELYFLI